MTCSAMTIVLTLTLIACSNQAFSEEGRLAALCREKKPYNVLAFKDFHCRPTP